MSAWRVRLHRPHPWEASQWPRLLGAGRATATALSLAVFALTLTLHDLHVLRFSPLYPGAALAVLIYGAGPPIFARRLGARIAKDHTDVPVAVEGARIRRRALLGLTLALFLAWLVLFTGGRTPRW